MYDIIGDIHGQAKELELLLEQLGYRRNGGSFTHETRQVIFLGDFIDRGDHQRGVLDIVRPMVDQRGAYAVMGNHEYNAIAYFTEKPEGGFLRDRSEKNASQHEKFLAAFDSRPEEWREVIDWFKTLPLWLDLDGLRIVHACWDGEYIRKIQVAHGGDSHLSDALLFASADKANWQHAAIETLLKGKEILLPGGQSFTDKDGHTRHEIRVRWWSANKTYRSSYFGPASALTHIPDDEITGDHMVEYGRSEKPVFFGHYWLEGDPAILAPNVACVDYSGAKPGGKLVAYRWDGEQELKSSNFAYVERDSCSNLNAD